MVSTETLSELLSDWTLAVTEADITKVQELLKVEPEILWTPIPHPQDDHLKTRLVQLGYLGTQFQPLCAVHISILYYNQHKDFKFTSYLIKESTLHDLDTRFWGQCNNTTLHLACFVGNQSIVNLLLERGIATQTINDLGYLPQDINPQFIQLKRVIPNYNNPDRFKLLKEIAENTDEKQIMGSLDRKASELQYFRKGRVRETQKKVLSEEEQIVEEQKKRQIEVAQLVKRSAVKNNPLYQKLEKVSTIKRTLPKPMKIIPNMPEKDQNSNENDNNTKEEINFGDESSSISEEEKEDEQQFYETIDKEENKSVEHTLEDSINSSKENDLDSLLSTSDEDDDDNDDEATEQIAITATRMIAPIYKPTILSQETIIEPRHSSLHSFSTLATDDNDINKLSDDSGVDVEEEEQRTPDLLIQTQNEERPLTPVESKESLQTEKEKIIRVQMKNEEMPKEPSMQPKSEPKKEDFRQSKDEDRQEEMLHQTKDEMMIKDEQQSTRDMKRRSGSQKASWSMSMSSWAAILDREFNLSELNMEMMNKEKEKANENAVNSLTVSSSTSDISMFDSSSYLDISKLEVSDSDLPKLEISESDLSRLQISDPSLPRISSSNSLNFTLEEKVPQIDKDIIPRLESSKSIRRKPLSAINVTEPKAKSTDHITTQQQQQQQQEQQHHQHIHHPHPTIEPALTPSIPYDSGYGKLYLHVNGIQDILLPLPKDRAFVRCVVSDGRFEYMSRYEVLNQSIHFDYECVIDAHPDMIITLSLHVRPDFIMKSRKPFSRLFSSRKKKECLSGYVNKEDGAIGQARFALAHMIPACNEVQYEAGFSCFNAWYSKSFKERHRQKKKDQDVLKVVGNFNVEMLYLSHALHQSFPRTLCEYNRHQPSTAHGY
ncbi:hypothetical protein G6F18_008747 [Rhizopus arrhizus]|nr:hypothetical protein G6F24_007580 [Rhizopus arrhizus]KAG0796511.1 hypothetical protein G6F21_001256 [Rhizopus arrhizus]KAG0810567.1 hypothetical protein G6F20_007853 [Rhizopus arrhizus]KAG0829129.1 hypothetical protein G6F18_008747 [Rhizopus arrhizus]KAG0881228.1 hypothetical protein G6F15_007896 [Rhizopus arrhizus]